MPRRPKLARRRRERVAARKRYNKYKKSLKVRTTCVCPKCRTRYSKRVEWTGRGTPRIYCRECRGVKDLSPEAVYPDPNPPKPRPV